MEIPVTTGTITYAITYLLLFRLAIVALGAFSIYLGYRLFTQALPLENAKDTHNESAELQAKVGNAELSLKQAAPGLFFAAFGALITVSILAAQQPEFKIEQTTSPTTTEGKPPITEETVTVRGGWCGGKLPETAEERDKAIWKHHEEALNLAKELVELQPKNEQYLDTLAEFLFLDDKFIEALEKQEKAVQLQPDNKKLQGHLKAYQAAVVPAN